MSVATSIQYPCIKLRSPSSSSYCPASSSSSTFKFSLTNTKHSPVCFTIIRNSQTEGPIRRPVAPSLNKPTPPSSPSSSPPPQPNPVSVVPGPAGEKSVVTLEFQRQKARELQDYFKRKKLEEANQGPFFGFVGKNEISNGRWAMFGFAVGMLTEYATGSDFVDQVKILLSNFGILDLD